VSYETLLYEQADHVVTLTLNRPDQHNAVNGAMNAELHDAWERFRDDEDAFVLVITGAGESTFCAGWDLQDAAELGEIGDYDAYRVGLYNSPGACGYTRKADIFKPVIAAVNGYCLGYGLTLVTWCDFVIASDRAEFGYPEALLGSPAIVGAIRLPQRINWQYAMELLLTGERIDAARAKEIGLAGWVVPHDSLMDEARALAARLVRAAPLAGRAMKEVALRSQHLSSLEAIRFGETMRIVAQAKQREANETGSPSAWSPPASE